MITTTDYHNPNQMQIVQTLVKRYDGRFVKNPWTVWNKTWTEISFENGNNFKLFSTMTRIIQLKHF